MLQDECLTVLEVGCGSGAISLSLIKEAKAKLRVLAVDQSEAACELTELNARALDVDPTSEASSPLRIVHTKVDLQDEDCGFQGMIAPSSLDIIVSNPPYVLRKDMTDLPDEIKV